MGLFNLNVKPIKASIISSPFNSINLNVLFVYIL